LNNDTNLKFKLIDFLEKMNTGNKLPIDDIETNYNQLQPLIDLLYTVNDFPVDRSNEDIYCFTKNDIYPRSYIGNQGQGLTFD